MTENQRLKEVQKTLGFSSQTKFADVLGIKQGSLSDIYREKNNIKVSDSIKMTLLKDYSININWLETGEGEMLKTPEYPDRDIVYTNAETGKKEVIRNPHNPMNMHRPTENEVIYNENDFRCSVIKKTQDIYGLSKNDFAEKIGVPLSVVRSWESQKKEIPNNLWENIVETFSLNEDELRSSFAEKHTVLPPATQSKLIPLLPISAMGGSLTGFSESVNVEYCERFISPVLDAEMAINVTGDSMYPEYPSGSRILLKRINEHAFIDWGRVFVLDTCNGIILKKLMPASEKGKVLAVSINPNYPPYEISLSDVYGIYRVLMCMSEK